MVDGRGVAEAPLLLLELLVEVEDGAIAAGGTVHVAGATATGGVGRARMQVRCRAGGAVVGEGVGGQRLGGGGGCAVAGAAAAEGDGGVVAVGWEWFVECEGHGGGVG